MLKSIVGVFNPSDAEQVRAALLAKGFPESAIHVTTGNTPSEDTEDGIMDPDQRASHEHESGIVHFFKDLFGMEDNDEHARYASSYSGAVRRGNSMVSVTVDGDDEIDSVESIMQSYNAIDIDEEDQDEGLRAGDNTTNSWTSHSYIPDNESDLRSAHLNDSGTVAGGMLASRNLGGSSLSGAGMGNSMSDSSSGNLMGSSGNMMGSSGNAREAVGREGYMGDEETLRASQRADSSADLVRGDAGNSGRSLTDSDESLTDKIADAGRAIKDKVTGHSSGSMGGSLTGSERNMDNLGRDTSIGSSLTGSDRTVGDAGRDTYQTGSLSDRDAGILGRDTSMDSSLTGSDRTVGNAGRDGYLTDEESIRESQRPGSSVDLTHGDMSDSNRSSTGSGESLTDKIADAGRSIKDKLTGDSTSSTMNDANLRSGSSLSDSSLNTGMDQDRTVLPVVKEDLDIGKRVVQRGGVRIFTRQTERPVEENIQLNQERVDVQRQPVDRPATEADMAAFKEGQIEMRETAEEPVVNKVARVVEEVVVGKHQEQRTETVRDTVRGTDVQVEPLSGSNTDLGRSTDSDIIRDDSNRPLKP